MQNLQEIRPPDDFITAGAKRCYETYAAQHKTMGMRFKPWDQLVITAKANWRAIFRMGLGPHEMVLMNRFEKNPHTVIVTGLTEAGMATFHQQLMSRVTRITEAATGDEKSDGDPANE